MSGPTIKVLVGDVIERLGTLPDHSVHCVVTSPPYWGLRNYSGLPGQLGREKTPGEYVANLVGVFREIRRVLHPMGTAWLNLGDSYAQSAIGRNRNGLSLTLDRPTQRANAQDGNAQARPGVPPKNLVGIPWRVAFALQEDNWYLRNDVIWAKPNPMPESVRDRCTKAHEYLFQLAGGARYYYDYYAVREPARCPDWVTDYTGSQKSNTGSGYELKRLPKNRIIEGDDMRNPRSVWSMTPLPFKGQHFATFPPALVERCVLAGTSERGACPICLAPYTRVLERERVPTRPGTNTKVAGTTGETSGNRDPERHVTRVVHKGWEPGCTCGAKTVAPCTVLDPFCGSGTTLVTAEHLGRNSIGIDLDPQAHEWLGIRRAEVTRWFARRDRSTRKAA